LSVDSISANPAKGRQACDILLKKYAEDCERYPKAKANFLTLKGTFLVQLGENADDAFQEALGLNPKSFKCRVKLILNKLGVLKKIYGK
jgi:hypothetical protein